MTLPDEPLSPFDLRIGNIVLNSEGKPIRIEYLTIKFDQKALTQEVSTFGGIINHGGEYSGIPIDNHWLKKLGFKEEDGGYALEDVTRNELGRFAIGNVPIQNLHYVHQLQNLLFAVRGFEPLIQL